MDQSAARVKLSRMALEIAEKLSHSDLPVVLLGVAPGGSILARQFLPLLQSHLPQVLDIVEVGLNKSLPEAVNISTNLSLTQKHVVLIDDVANSGKTLLYALKPVLAFQPASITTLVLVERMHRTFPVKPDVVGMSVSTTPQQHIEVETNGQEVLGVSVQ